MVNVVLHCYAINYGKDYLKVFEQRLVDAVRVMRQSRPGNRLTFTLGIRTSHGQVAQAEETKTHPEIASRVGMQVVAIFTWSSLQHYWTR